MLEEAHYYFNRAADVLGLSKKVRTILSTPFRVSNVEVVTEDDDGQLLHHTSWRGPMDRRRPKRIKFFRNEIFWWSPIFWPMPVG
jgi:hypothetical protein